MSQVAEVAGVNAKKGIMGDISATVNKKNVTLSQSHPQPLSEKYKKKSLLICSAEFLLPVLPKIQALKPPALGFSMSSHFDLLSGSEVKIIIIFLNFLSLWYHTGVCLRTVLNFIGVILYSVNEMSLFCAIASVHNC